MTPSSHDPNRLHTISALLVCLLSGWDLHMVQNLANTGTCFIKLDWGFPGLEYPSFTTRHLLTGIGGFTEVSFSGGLDWAQKTVKNARAFQVLSGPAQGLQPPRIPALADCDEAQKRALQRSSWTWPLPASKFESLTTPQIPEISRPMSLEPADDEVSLCSDLTSATTISDADTSTFSSCVSDSTEVREPSPGINCAYNYLPDCQVRQQAQGDMLHAQWRDAEAMFARDGDTSGLLAVLVAASRSRSGESWQPSGIPRF